MTKIELDIAAGERLASGAGLGRVDEGDGARIVKLDRDALERYGEAAERDSRNGRMNSPTEWVEVTDENTGDVIEIAPGPCGADCRCAMWWREKQERQAP